MSVTQTGRECIKDHRAHSAQGWRRLSCSGLAQSSGAITWQTPLQKSWCRVLHPRPGNDHTPPATFPSRKRGTSCHNSPVQGRPTVCVALSRCAQAARHFVHASRNRRPGFRSPPCSAHSLPVPACQAALPRPFIACAPFAHSPSPSAGVRPHPPGPCQPTNCSTLSMRCSATTASEGSKHNVQITYPHPVNIHIAAPHC